jgi:hypothetical protein
MSETTAITHPAATPNLNKALSLLQGEMPKVTKTKTGKIEGENKAGKYFSYEYSYADLGDVVADMGPLMAKHGLAFHCAPMINPADRREMILVWSLLHESGEERSGEWPLGPVNQKPQSLGSMVTYARRYCLGAATGIVAEEDDDGQRAQRDHGSRQSAGDAWDSATAARPVNQGPGRERTAAAAPAAGPADTGDARVRPWLEYAIEDAGTKLWHEAGDKARRGEIASEEMKQVREVVTARIDDLRKAECDKLLRLLSESDPWRLKVEELADADSAQAALEELGQAVTSNQMDMTRANRVSRAIAARFPKAATEGQVAA